MDIKTYDLDRYGETHKISLELGVYSNGNLAVMMNVWETNEYYEPWSTLTINLDKRKENCSFIDTNNNGDDIIQWVESIGLAKLTGECGYSGFCKYPEMEFNEEMLREINSDIYDDYIATYKKREVCK